MKNKSIFSRFATRALHSSFPRDPAPVGKRVRCPWGHILCPLSGPYRHWPPLALQAHSHHSRPKLHLPLICRSRMTLWKCDHEQQTVIKTQSEEFWVSDPLSEILGLGPCCPQWLLSQPNSHSHWTTLMVCLGTWRTCYLC